jgi:hypothetical protein
MTRIFSGGDSGSAEWFSTWLWRTRDKRNTYGMVKVLNMREVDGRILVYVTVPIYTLFTKRRRKGGKAGHGP